MEVLLFALFLLVHLFSLLQAKMILENRNKLIIKDIEKEKTKKRKIKLGMESKNKHTKTKLTKALMIYGLPI